MAGIHIVALFETSAAANAAQAGLLATGVDASRILLLDSAHEGTAAHTASPARLWGLLKHVFVPTDDAHPYAEGISRGHPLLIADVTEGERQQALLALQAAQPLNIDAQAETWREEGWDGVHPGEEAFLGRLPEGREAAGSEGMAGGLILGDYGAVGGMIGGRADTDILRGKSFLGGERSVARADAGAGDVRVYEVE